MKKNNLAEKFLADLEVGAELSPALRNTGFLIQATSWNTEKYFKKAYDDRKPFPLLILMKEKEGLLYFPMSKAKNSSAQVFKKYWKNSKTLGLIDKEFKSLDKAVQVSYEEFINGFGKLSQSTRNKLVKQAMDSAWTMNAIVFCSIYFDKPMAEYLLQDLKSKISPNRLSGIWDKAIDPLADSFEVRRQRYFINLIIKGRSLDEIAKECLFFETSYEYLPTINELKNNFVKKFKKLLDKKAAIDHLKKIDQEKIIKIKEYNAWQNKLSFEEKKVVNYVQAIIRWRDERKDAMAKLSTMLLMTGKDLLTKAGLDDDLALYCLVTELFKGERYLKSISKDLIKRKRGSMVLVSGKGRVEVKCSGFNQGQKTLDSFFSKQNSINNKKEVVGQTGAPGKTIGKVRVVRNFKLIHLNLRRVKC
jgi:hypothetical protein